MILPSELKMDKIWSKSKINGLKNGLPLWIGIEKYNSYQIKLLNWILVRYSIQIKYDNLKRKLNCISYF